VPWNAATAIYVLLLSGCAAAGVSDRALAVHDFDRSAEGWLIAGDTGTREPIFRPEGGRSGGYIYSDDEALGETWYFRAPASLLAHLGAAEGGRLSYSLKQSSDVQGYPDDDIVIQGPAGRLSYRFGRQPGTDWTDFSVRLSADEDWRWNWNARATAEQIRRVLGAPERLEIRGEYQTGDDTGSLDRVVLTVGAE
jgi:hypothetical protein